MPDPSTLSPSCPSSADVVVETPAVDLNADLGEGCAHDRELLEIVSSANIACGAHAGDPPTMMATVEAAVARGVAIGAHPSFPDRANFGRSAMDLPVEVVRAHVLAQIGALAALARTCGGRLHHVKPHGALYNQAARDPVLARVIARAVRDFDPGLLLFGLAGSASIVAARELGLTAVEEVFADRGYEADGSLVKRGTPGDLIEDDEQALEQTLGMVAEGRVRARDGSLVPIHAETICLHGDGAHALAFARRIRAGLEARGVAVLAPGSDRMLRTRPSNP